MRPSPPVEGPPLAPEIRACSDIGYCVYLVGVERCGLRPLLADLLLAQRGGAGCPLVSLWPAHPQRWLRLRPASNRP